MIQISEATAKILIGLASIHAASRSEKRAIRDLAEALRNPVGGPPSEGLGK